MDIRDCYLMVRRKKQTFVFQMNNTDSVLKLKQRIESLSGVPARNIRLFNQDNMIMEDNSILAVYNLNISTAPAEKPAFLTMVHRLEDGNFEDRDVTPYAEPSPLPEILQPSTPGPFY